MFLNYVEKILVIHGKNSYICYVNYCKMATEKKHTIKKTSLKSSPIRDKTVTITTFSDIVDQQPVKAYVYPTEPTNSKNLLSDVLGHYQIMYSNPITVFTNSKKGLSPKAALDFLFISGFTHIEFQEVFKTTVKTIQNYIVQDLKLDSMLSEKLLKSFALFDKGVDVFGSGQEFYQWLHTSSYGLGNQIPFDLMDTITGINLVEEELIRIEFGDLA